MVKNNQNLKKWEKFFIDKPNILKDLLVCANKISKENKPDIK